MMAQLSEAADWMDGSYSGPAAGFDGVSIDSRSLSGDDLFFAISGPNFDGHDYVSAALEKGAAGAVIDRSELSSDRTIVVDDARKALGRLGRAWRRQYSPLTIGITGSNGKTTLKGMIASICARLDVTLATEGNLNNDLGVPLMLLRLRPEHRFAVIEMGANHIGEIAYLTSLVEPDIVLLGNAGPAHLEGFGSLDGVARGKGEILQGEPRPRCAILNADDAYFDYWSGLVADIDSLSFGLEAEADVSATDIALDADGSTFRLQVAGEDASVRLPLPGLHNVRNACAATAVSLAAGLSLEHIVEGLQNVQAVDGRLAAREGINSSRIFDDSYNANPGSVLAAGRFVAAQDGRSIFVLGDMFELGDEAKRIHHETGVALREAGVDALFATGDMSRHAVEGFGDNARWFDSVEALSAALSETLADDCIVLVKGSRSMRMERVVEALSVGEMN